VIGPNGARMQAAVKALLVDEARTRPDPSDWVYVNNFTAPDRPIAIELPAGRARIFQGAMHKLIDDLKTALPAVFQSEDYQTRRGVVEAATAIAAAAGAELIVISIEKAKLSSKTSRCFPANLI
jgi:hypothetical protein